MNNLLNYRDYLATVEVSEEDGCLHGRIEFIEDLVTFDADSYDELVQEFHDAVDDYLETCKTLGKEPDKPFKGTFNVRIGSELHKRAAVAARKSDRTLNDFVKDAVEKSIGEENVIRHEHHHTVEMTTTYTFPTQDSKQWLTPAQSNPYGISESTRRLTNYRRRA